jgi:hypothetical protein
MSCKQGKQRNQAPTEAQQASKLFMQLITAVTAKLQFS